MLQMVASNRGVAAMPRWLVEEYEGKIDVLPVRLGQHGLMKKIYLGIRKSDAQVEYIGAFIRLARQLVSPDFVASTARRRVKRKLGRNPNI